MSNLIDTSITTLSLIHPSLDGIIRSSPEKEALAGGPTFSPRGFDMNLIPGVSASSGPRT